ncbi:uncharacterized protein KIAA2026 [Denticeps clupeoides]|uniref:Bromo domain-containing protein n=1 Tax=Denticeps clupeoides TaxID=299321 RepID=A0AAY4DTF2_9TELE|nr:uncharacterized protein KIAA2026 homolog [Denticeps clupeoides]
MKVQSGMSGTETCSLPDAPVSSVVVCKDVAESRDGNTRLLLHSCDPSFDLSNGISSVAEGKHRRNPDYLDVRDDQTEISEDSLSLPDVCSPHAASEDEDLNYEVQQAFKIFHSFLLEKHKAITAPFWLPIGPEETSMLEPPHQGMSLKRIDEKFVKREYESITDFVADFRLLLENCYRHHGVDHWISKQAQKLEIILEQKLTLLSRTLRDKTTLAVTSKGRFGTEDEKVPVGSSMRRRSVPRSLATITVGGSESLMVQALRLEERQRAKEEKRQRELEKKEAEEASAKEVVEWDHDLLSQAAPWPVETLWELPAIGHFLCLAQNALNLPEIVFFELERCLLMPRCSTFLAKIMTSLLCQPHRRATLHRRPALSYRCWEAELRRKVVGWYQAVGRAEDQAACAEQLGLCNQFFWTLGESSPLEEAAFHLLPFNQRVWLLKGLCDNVYETHKDVQDAVLGQPIHECRESILGYDIRENAYIHFPHFCGADLRIYCQSPCTAVDFPLPPIRVQRLEKGAIVQGFIRPKEEVHSVKTKEEAFEMEKLMEEADRDCLKEDSGDGNLYCCDRKTDGEATDFQSEDEREAFLFHCSESCSPEAVKEEPAAIESRDPLSKEGCSSDGALHFRVGESCYRGKSPANSANSSLKPGEGPTTAGEDPCPECRDNTEAAEEQRSCCCTKAQGASPPSGYTSHTNSAERQADKVCTKKKKRKKKKVKELSVKKGRRKKAVSTRIGQVRVAKSTVRKAATTIKKKDKRKKQKLGKKIEFKKTTSKKEKDAPKAPIEPSFKLVCTSLEELRDLINKTEDEMDELESTKKKSGRWYYKREAVKELHMTLIRLLNELSPWEPKLVKAFQRNRARLKKDYDDFKKHPDYCKFVREKRLEEEVEAVKGLPEATDLSPETEEANKSELDEMGNSSQLGTEPFPSSSVFGQDIDNVNEHRPFTRSSKRQLSGVTDEDLCHNKRAKVSIMDPLSTEYLAEEVARESSPAVQILQSSGETSTSFTTAANSHKSYTPIQALLAKSVGNKVTLIKHNPAAVTEANQPIQSKSSSEPLSSSNTLSVNTAPPTVHNTSTPAQVQVVYKLPGDLGVNRKDNSPLNFSVQPVVDTKAVETRMQQVIFLPPNLLVQRSDGKEPQHPGVFPLPASKTLVPPNDCSGFTVAEHKIPIQQVAPLEDQCLIQTPSPTVSSSLCATSVPPYKGVESQKVTTADSNKCPSTNPPDTKQELKTVCIRDSQSILVTTRGGNTGVVKVQTSDQSTVNSLPASPVFTLSPKFKAILVSKSSPSFASSQPAVTTTAQSQPTAVPLFSRPSPLTCVNQVLPSGVDTVNAKKSTSTYDTVSVLNKIHSSVAGSQTVPTQSIGTVNSPLSQGGVGVLLAGIPNIPPPIPSNTVQKRSQTDLGVPDQSPFQKIFLVTPPANVSVCGMSKGPMDSALSGSKLMLINQTTASSCSAVAVPKQPLFTHASTSTVVESGSLNQVQSIMPRPPTTEAALPLKNSIPVTVSGLLTTNTGGLICPIRSRSLVTNSVRQYLPVQSIKGPEGIPSTVKTLQFSALSTGSFAGSTLLTAAQLQSVPMSASTTVSSFSCKKTDQAASSILSTVIPSVGGVISKDQSLVKGLSPNSPCFPSPVVTSSAAMPVMAPPGTFRPLTLSSNIPSQHANLPHPHKTVVTPTVRPPADCSSASTVQQKIVINTSAPLAPGTQILINNACFVVPAQGLAPGSHVLVIPRPVASPGDATALPRLPGIPVPSPVPQSSQGPRMTTPGKQPQLGALKAPLPFTVKVQQSCTSVLTPVPCQGTLKEHLPTSSSSALAAASQLACSSVSTSQHTEPTAMRFSSALIPEGKAITVPPVPMLDSYPKPTATSSAQAQGASQFTVNQTLLHAGFPLSQTQLTSVLPPVGPVVSQKKALSVVTTVAASSVCSRLLTLPVATVPPTGSTFSNRPTNPNTAAAPPSNTVIMEMCPPIRTMPVVLTNPPLNLGKTTLHSSTPGALPSSSPKKLLLSPDGAVLNVVRGPVVAALPTLAAQMGLSSSDQGVVPSAQTSQGELNC